MSSNGSSETDITKKAHIKSTYTGDEMMDMLSCVEDPLFFMRKFMKVQHPMKGAMAFEPYPFQVRLIEGFNNNRFVIGLTARQMGKTTCAAGFLLWKAMFSPDTTILIAANKLVQALEIMDRIRYAYENLPDFVRAGVIEYNKGTISFDNGSKIVSRATSPDAGRGMSITMLYLDEFAFVHPGKATEFWTSIQPVLSCVAGDTLVLTDTGFRQIEELHSGKNVGEYFRIEGTQVFGKHGMEPLSHGYVSPHSATLVIETERGFRVEVTEHHPLYTLRGVDTGMIRADELRVGDDQLRIQFNMGIFGTSVDLARTSCKQLTQELAYLVGGMVAEGWITKRRMKNGAMRNTLSVSNTDKEFRDRFTKNSIIVPFREVPSNPARLSVNSAELVKLFEEIGFESNWRSDSKRIPHRILTAPRSIQIAFLQGLYDGDGCGGGDRINLSSVSRKLLEQVQCVMMNLGFISTIRQSSVADEAVGRRLPGGRSVKTSKACFALNISAGQRREFLRAIGFGLERKNAAVRAEIKKRPGEGKTLCIAKTAGIVNFIKEVVAKSTKNAKWFREQGVRLDKAMQLHTTKGVVTHKLLTNLRSVIEENGLPLHRPGLFDELVGNFLWDRIKSITKSTNQTYDFTVPATHSFIQNGILGSNTGGSCIITSTPKSDEDMFAQIWKGAIDRTDDHGNPRPGHLGKNDFFGIMVPWHEHPERDEAWAKPFRETLGEARFRQEFCCVTGDTMLTLKHRDGTIEHVTMQELSIILSVDVSRL